MALDSLYIDKAMKFPDWEYGDDFAETFEADGYTPTLSFIFLWEIYKQIGKTTWLEIEEEFRREIGTEKYNKEGWMQNKAKLYKLINKKYKKPSKAKVASLESKADDDTDSDNDDIIFEMDDGTILKIHPKFKGSNGAWRQNFTRQFNLQQGSNSRWQSRRNNNNHRSDNNNRYQNNQNGNGNTSLNNKNYNNNANNNRRNNNRGDKPSPDQTWKCRRCENEGKNRILRGDQQCPRHNWRPRYFDSIPIAAIKSMETEKSETNEQEKQKAALASIRMQLYGDDELTDQSF